MAIGNGLKLVENCFEKHKLKLDPSSSRSEETIVFRPIDQYYSRLPYLIGSDKWKEKWHLGLMESEDQRSQSGSVYADSVDSSITSKQIEQNIAEPVNLSTSQDSLAKSINSVGDQMVINSRQRGLFDQQISSDDLGYKAQSTPKNIVNFFEVEPPELLPETPSPQIRRKPANLFDDVESVESLPIYEPENNKENQQHKNVSLPPVDLFDDNDFDDFITKMEKNRNQMPNVEETNVEKSLCEEKVIDTKSKTVNVQREMKSIADELKKKLSQKKSEQEVKDKQGVEVKHEDKNAASTEVTQMPSKKFTPKGTEAQKHNEIKTEIKSLDNDSKIKTVFEDDTKLSVAKPKQRIANLFEDEDDSEDFFQEIINQKSVNTPKNLSKDIEPVKQTSEKKISNLFDESDEEDDFHNIFKEKTRNFMPKIPDSESSDGKNSKTASVSLIKSIPSIKSKSTNKLLDDESDNEKDTIPSGLNDTPSSLSGSKNVDITIEQKTSKKLFDDDSDNDENYNLFKSSSKQVTQISQENKNIEYSLQADRSDNSLNVKKYIGSSDSESNQKIKSSVIDVQEVKKELTNIDPISKSELFNDDKEQNIAECMETMQKSDHLPKTETADEVPDDLCSSRNDVHDEAPKIDFVNSPKKEKFPMHEEDEQSNNQLSITPERYDTENEQPNLSQQQIVDTLIKSNFTMPLFSDEPPEDDPWDQKFDTFEEPETKPQEIHSTFLPNISNYSVGLFDEIPPEDFGDSQANPPPIPEFNDDLSDFDDKIESHLDIPEIDDSSVKEVIKAEKVAVGENNLNIYNDKESAITVEIPVSLNQKIENKSITPDNTDVIEENDDKSPNVLKTSIKSKLDMFSRPQESAPIKIIEPKKLPGKLNTNLKINVGALMPGARVSIRKQITNEEPSDLSESSEMQNKPKTIESSTGLLNNDMTKSRAKITVKRRPSTRSGRRSNYEKSLSLQMDDKEESKRDEMNIPYVDATKNESSVSSIAEPSLSQQNLLKTIFGDDNEGDDFLSKLSSKVDKSTPHNPPVVTTSKISVFYDDEAETKKMLEEQKKKEIIKETTLKLFDEVSEDDNLFANINAPISDSESANFANQKLKPKQKIKKQIQASLFEDDNDDDDLFGSKTSTHLSKGKEVLKEKSKSKPLFDDEDEDLFGVSSNDKKSISKNIQPAKSLFSDESDDDDLFSSKTKSSESFLNK